MGIRVSWVLGFIMVLLVSFTSCKVTKQATSAPTVTAQKDTLESNLTEEQQKAFDFYFLDGIKQKTLENSDEAIKLFSHCLEIDSRSAAALYELADIHVTKGDYQSSMFLMEKAVALHPENEYYHLLLVRIYQQNHLFEKAADEYQKIAGLLPDHPDFPLYQAAMLTMAGKNDEALALYNRLEEKGGISESIAVGKQQIYTQKGDKQAAYAELEKLIAAYPAESKYYGLLADLYLNDKERGKAFENYQKVLAVAPNDGFVHLSLASYYLDDNDSLQAFQHIKLAFQNTELDLETKAQMYMLLIKPGPQKLSDVHQLELLHILLEAHLDDERPRGLMVDYYQSHKMPQEARRELLLVLDMRKDNWAYWEQLLLLDNELMDWMAMSQDTKRAKGYFPEQPLIYLLQAVGFFQQKKYNEVLTEVEAGLAYAKNDPKIESQFYTYRAEALYSLKRFTEAFDLFDKAVQLDPENYMVMNNYAYYLSLRGERLGVAEKLSGKVIQANPDNATYLDTYAWIFFVKKDYALAKFYMENALTKGLEESAVLYEHYGDILFHLQEKDKAMDQWRKSLQMGNPSKVLKRKIAEKRYFETKE